MTSSTDQVSIDMENLKNTNKQINTLSTDTVDGPYSNRSTTHRRRNSRGSNGSGHRYNQNHNHNHSGESDVDDRAQHQHRQNQHRERRRSRSRSISRSDSPSRRKRSTTDVPPTERDHKTNSHDVEPLLVTDIDRRDQQTELFDDESDGNVTETHRDGDNSGIDDGFIVGDRDDQNKHEHDYGHKDDLPSNNNNQPNGTDINRPFPSMPPSFGRPDVFLDANGNPQVIPDINVYQQKKNLAQGMMDLALLSANANQLRYVLETYVRHPYFWFSFVFIVMSLILQVAVGVGLILNSRYNVKNREQICRADKINNFTILGIFLITAVNVFIAAFGVADPPATP